MDRKYLPAVLTLAAGAVTCVVNLVRQYPAMDQMVLLLIVLIVFYVLGNIIKWTLDLFDHQNENFISDEGEVIEKESEDFDL